MSPDVFRLIIDEWQTGNISAKGSKLKGKNILR